MEDPSNENSSSIVIGNSTELVASYSSVVEKKTNEIGWIQSKIHHLESQINEEMEDFPENIQSRMEDQFEDQFREMYQRYNQKMLEKDKDVLKASFDVHMSFMCMPLFYNLDSFINDLKRCVEFGLREIKHARFPRHRGDDQFSVGSFLDKFEDDYNSEKGEFFEYLENHHPEFIQYIEDNLDWLKTVRYHRTDLAHKEIDFRTAKLKFEKTWKQGSSYDDTEEEMVPEELLVHGEPVEEYVEGMRENIDDFVGESQKMVNSLKLRRMGMFKEYILEWREYY